MKIKLILMGKTVDSSLGRLIDVYKNRIAHYVNFETIIIPELKNAKNLTEEQQKTKEAELIIDKTDKNDDLILLDEKGKQYSSIEFSKFLENKSIYSNRSIVFVVGGAYGFAPALYRRADGLISLSLMTFSHQLVRVIFMEQLYRAMTIIKGEPYHHE